MIKIKSHLEKIFRSVPTDLIRNDFIRLDMNEDPSGLPEDFIRTALKEINADYLSCYPEYSSLITKIAEHNDIGYDNVCLSNGSDSAIKYIFETYISSEDTVLLTDPTFAMYPVYCQIAGATSIAFPYNKDFSFSCEDFINLIDNKLKMVVVVNPNNPTGTVLSQQDLKKIIDKCAEYDVLVVVDEAYYYFYEKTVMPLIKQYDNIIVLRTFSKLCGLANLRLGYAAADSSIIQHLHKVKPTFDVNGLAILFAKKILSSKEIIEKKIEEINNGKCYLEEKLKEHGFDYYAGQANFILIKCKGEVSDTVRELQNKKILVAGGFKQDIFKNYIRVTVGNIELMKNFWSVFQLI
jgi:histidinol-phosphate aminotransferase